MPTQGIPLATPEEYLAFDRNSDIKNEYVFGEIVAMAGRTPWHSLLAANTISVLHRQLSGGPCRVFGSGLRVCVSRDALYAYPDVTVVCGPLEYLDARRDTVLNPKLLVEVLSPSTRNYDLGDKARMYFGVPSVEELLLIEQDKVCIEHWRRQTEGRWVEVAQDLHATVKVASLGCDILLREIYSGVEF